MEMRRSRRSSRTRALSRDCLERNRKEGNEEKEKEAKKKKKKKEESETAHQSIASLQALLLLDLELLFCRRGRRTRFLQLTWRDGRRRRARLGHFFRFQEQEMSGTRELRGA
jgi:hypothetical protein